MSKSLEWDNLGFSLLPWIRTGLDVMGFETMTPVQASTIPMLAGNKDVVVDSVTGSGKTAAFVIPVLEKVVKEEANTSKFKKAHFHSLIIAPTRELSRQIESVVLSFLEHYPSDLFPIKCQLLVGTNEATVRDDVSSFLRNRPQILIGTPGRVLDFLQMPAVKTSACSMVVMDEADRLLDMSFIKDTEKILRLLPKQRRTGLFSATMRSAGSDIFKTGLRNPVRITVNSKNQAPSSLKLNYCVVNPAEKLQLLVSILNNYKFKKCIVYFPTCVSVSYFYSFIQYLGKRNILVNEVEVFSLHGKLQTSARTKTLTAFTDSLSNSVLFTTDVAARGIDIPDVDLVIQLDPPTNTDMFMHRCGRTGRANRVGKAITFLNEGREEDFIPFMQVKNVELEELDLEVKGITTNFYEDFRNWILEDRDRFDKGVKAYVAFIKYYSNHSATSIFRLQSLDYVGIAKLYGLFRLPRMPEITKYLATEKQEGIFPGNWLVDPPVNMDEYKYKDKKREKERQETLKNISLINDKKKLKSELKKKNLAWSDKTLTKERKLERKEKMSLKRKAIEEELKAEELDENAEEERIKEDWKEIVLQNKRKKVSSKAIQGNFDDL
ncbi:ADI_G0018630.mRNA.1.CDS.1 [Saccharomyces cerevisiae]|uniref:ATP-dependent RNA helicase n=1 Tax=Saccharomyces cerevisiae (strain RM11-1a) TaxID=285006 RepID=B3LUK7_YEAS1|nr:Spb4p [Saccharomyces cerevisiae YJM993]AJU35620.1 Spb4p [Saccharomyces cerevisiae YJM244]AJU36533.1 Spb4p [Saccharomyces cerevisiae YJM453]AJU37791.1 Spb4p [Saccharomyces cerevisiae YJM969]AJU37894.1 Spb4p [Saccharomyces cerevisiae YJM972]AJU37995.1 Spb4p [Saccharomyces cerevisiae YJM975]AJU38097.1 Spb4p [Saccharomyces cerevisiae YJM978]AJU38197.1 Spb4p [Saccharomyces cerevisiae YJM981]AJU38297.1 Spb4p [Saccharomyces cerevisiae YJM984]AJU38397.1 Spb4p [Saccharomyces cerevisiae YJM987]A